MSSKKVYVVTLYDYYSGFETVTTVFTNNRIAEKYIEKQGSPNLYSIYECDLREEE